MKTSNRIKRVLKMTEAIERLLERIYRDMYEVERRERADEDNLRVAMRALERYEYTDEHGELYRAWLSAENREVLDEYNQCILEFWRVVFKKAGD